MWYISTKLRRRSDKWLIYAAVPAVLIAIALHFAMEMLLKLPWPPFVLLWPIVFAIAAFGGLRAGLLATFTGTISSFLLAPSPSIHLISLATFTAIGVCVSFIGERYINRRIAAAKLELENIQLIAAQNRLEVQHQLFISLADNNQEFIGICDREFKPFYVNPAGMRMVGLDNLQSACECKVQDYFFPEDQAFITNDFFPRVLREGRGEVEIRFRHFKTGEPIWMLYNVFAVYNSDGTSAGWATVSRNITERKRGEELLRLAKAEAENASRIKDEFLAALSHELRTPLTSVLAWTQMLKEGSFTQDKISHALEVIERNIRRQSHLINDLLDISRINAGKMTIERQPLDFNNLMLKSVASFKATANARQVELTYEGSDEVMLNADAARLQQVADNLLSNALKFTAPGGRISVCLEATGGMAELVVTDTGCGVKADFLPRMFDSFSQEVTDSSFQNRGLGLGLAISRRIVELHGGTISARSEGEGKGTTMIVRLPLAMQRTAETPAAMQGYNADALVGARILLVEDDPDIREALSDALRLAGAQLEAAESAQQTLQLLEHFQPTVMVCDIGLPGDDGYVLLEKVREYERQHGRPVVPAIAQTGYASEVHVRKIRASGYAAHLAKPLDLNVLIDTIRKIGEVQAQPQLQRI